MNSGNGAAGPTFDILQQKCKALGSKVDFQHLLSKPDSKFPYGIPNPLLSKTKVYESSYTKI